MRGVLLVCVLALLGLVAYVLHEWFAVLDDARYNRRLRASTWTATEYTTPDNRVHVVLRRSFVHRGEVVLADHDRELAVVAADDPEYSAKLAEARLHAAQEADRTNYRLGPPAMPPRQ